MMTLYLTKETDVTEDDKTSTPSSHVTVNDANTAADYSPIPSPPLATPTSSPPTSVSTPKVTQEEEPVSTKEDTPETAQEETPVQVPTPPKKEER